MDPPKDLRARAAWETATEIVALIRWDREEQRADAFVETLLVVEAGFERYGAAQWQMFTRALGEPGRN